ncbi:MAG TPA: MFS transporter, partial [Caulobacteraceae bacterium]
GALAPLLGGWLIDGVGWRWIFLINLPIAAGAVILSLAAVPSRVKGEAGAPLDLSGAVLATLALGALTWALTLGSGEGGWTPMALTLLSVGLAAAGGFVWVEKRKGDAAMAPLALFGSRSFVGLSLLTLLLYGALGGLMVLLPYVLIRSGGYSATEAGAALLPFPLVIAVTSPVMGALTGRIGARLPLTLGPLIAAVGFLLALRVGQGGSYWTTVLPAVLVISIGMAGAVAPLTTAVLASVDARHTGSASGFNSAIARTGGLVATALLGLVLAAFGATLISEFRAAAVVGALAAVAASASAFLLIENRRPAGDR